jgi:hypothetical protein
MPLSLTDAASIRDSAVENQSENLIYRTFLLTTKKSRENKICCWGRGGESPQSSTLFTIDHSPGRICARARLAVASCSMKRRYVRWSIGSEVIPFSAKA